MPKLRKNNGDQLNNQSEKDNLANHQIQIDQNSNRNIQNANEKDQKKKSVRKRANKSSNKKGKKNQSINQQNTHTPSPPAKLDSPKKQQSSQSFKKICQQTTKRKNILSQVKSKRSLRKQSKKIQNQQPRSENQQQQIDQTQRKLPSKQSKRSLKKISQKQKSQQLLLREIQKSSYLQQQQTKSQKSLSHSQNSSQQQSQSQVINFNKRNKRSKRTNAQIIDMIYSKYKQDQQSYNQTTAGQSYQGSSDLVQFDLLVKKKEKKEKKPKPQKQIRIKNKYFSDIAIQQKKDDEEEKQTHYGEEDIPQNNQKLVIQKKQPTRHILTNLQKIQTRVSHLKDRREFKNSQMDLKFKNHFKNKLEEVKYAEEVEIDIEVPNLFTKKTASAALYMKNTIDKEQKKLHKANSIDSSSGNHNINNLKKGSKLNSQQQSHFPSINKPSQISQQPTIINKKKGIRRSDFYNNLTNEIKLKNQTSISSQQIKDCFKTSSLDDNQLDFNLVEEVISCSSNNSSRNSSRRGSQDSRHSGRQINLSNNNKTHLSNASNKVNPALSDINNSNNQHSQGFRTNTHSRPLNFSHHNIISQVKQSQGSSIQNVDSISLKVPNKILNNYAQKGQNTASMRFNTKQIQEQVKKQLGQTYKLLESDDGDERFNGFGKRDKIQNKLNKNKSTTQKRQYEPEKMQIDQDARLKQIQNKKDLLQTQQQKFKLIQKVKSITKKGKLKRIKQKQPQNNNALTNQQPLIQENISDNQESLKKLRRNNKKSKKPKKPIMKKNTFSMQNLDQFFQQQADYSSSQQGHTDQQQNDPNEQDYDQNGNLIDLIDHEQISNKNQHLVRKKYLQDQQKLQQQMIQKIMRNMYGRNKHQQTQSQKRLKRRMKEAADKFKEQDKDQKFEDEKGGEGENDNKSTTYFDSFDNMDTNRGENDVDSNGMNERERRKLRDLEIEIAHNGGPRIVQQDEYQSATKVQKKQNWKLITAALPIRQTHHIASIPKSGIKRRITSRQTSGQNKHLFDQKKGCVQLQIHRKRKSLDRRPIQSIGNRNKLQKTTQIQLDIREKNIELNEQFQI